MPLAIVTILATAALAFANGSNDVSKGVATLAGSGRASYRRAIAWGTLWTAAGAFASVAIAAGLAKAFTTALVAPDVLLSPAFPLSVAAGAAGWVLFASFTGLPVSTTHALTGAIVGVALTAGGPPVLRWPLLLAGIAAPLALSPLVSGMIGYGIQGAARRLTPACLCVGETYGVLSLSSDGIAAATAVPRLVASAQQCDQPGMVRRFMPADALHWMAAAALSFARGVNDNVKLAAIAALGFGAFGMGLQEAFVLTALGMTAGSYAAGLRVTRTLGDRVVNMDSGTGLAAALVAASLVLIASFSALPVSTTHVSTGAIVGAGVHQGRGAVQWRTVGALFSAWVITLPVAGALGALTAVAMRVLL